MAACLAADEPSAWDLYERGREAEKAGPCPFVAPGLASLLLVTIGLNLFFGSV